jgi:hypothetical protein
MKSLSFAKMAREILWTIAKVKVVVLITLLKPIIT